LMIAWRYGSSLASASVIGFDMEAFAISVRSLQRTRGFVMRYRNITRMAVAVVSDPAILDEDAVRYCS
jgi:hypothetical protein